jgi:O-antigen ligase
MMCALAVAHFLPQASPEYGLQNFFPHRQGSNLNDASSDRLEIWRATLSVAMEHPLLGVGIDQYQFYRPQEFGSLKQPHNWPLQILFSTGIAGLLLVPLALLPIVTSKSATRLRYFEVPAAACLAGLLVYSCYDAAGYYLYPLTIGAIALASLREPSPPAPDRSD